MRSRALISVSWLALLAACGSASPTTPKNPAPAVAGQYVLWKVDGLPCCNPNEPGYAPAPVVLRSSVLEIGWNTAPGRYVWGVTRQDTLADGTTKSVSVLYSAGTYTWNPATLAVTLTDTINGGRLTGTTPSAAPLTLQGTLQGSEHTYEFGKLVELP